MAEQWQEIWTIRDDAPHPVKVKCLTFEWRHHDSHGDEMLPTTHFRTEGEAWAHLTCRFQGWVHEVGRDIKKTRGLLAKLNEEAGEAAVLYAEACKNYEQWQAGLMEKGPADAAKAG